MAKENNVSNFPPDSNDVKDAKEILKRKVITKLEGRAKLSIDPDELDTIKRAWRGLDPGVKDLAKMVFPEIAAYLLLSKLCDESMAFLYD